MSILASFAEVLEICSSKGNMSLKIVFNRQWPFCSCFLYYVIIVKDVSSLLAITATMPANMPVLQLPFWTLISLASLTPVKLFFYKFLWTYGLSDQITNPCTQYFKPWATSSDLFLWYFHAYLEYILAVISLSYIPYSLIFVSFIVILLLLSCG